MATGTMVHLSPIVNVQVRYTSLLRLIVTRGQVVLIWS
jgi:hypothetical protein